MNVRLARLSAVALAVLAAAGVAASASAPVGGPSAATDATTSAAPVVRHLSEDVTDSHSGTMATRSTTAARTTSGYTLTFGKRTAMPKGGLTIVVAPKAPHRAALATFARNAVRAQQAAGLNVRFGGYATSTSQGKAVVVSENQGGCGTGVLASTNVGVLDYGSHVVVDASTVHACKGLWAKSSEARNAAMLHEFGHAVGLGHFNGTVNSRRQIMNAQVQPQHGSYQHGDIDGLDSVAGA